MTTSTTPSTPRCPGSARATTPTSDRWPRWQRRCATASSTPATYSSFRKRRHGRPLDTATAFRPPGCWPTPAPTTRSATARSGDRPSQNLTYGQLAVKAALVLGSPYTAMLFMGEEWGASTPFQFFSSHPEPELARATAEGRKEEFADHGWDADEIPDPQDPQTFQRSKLDWDEVDTGEHAPAAAASTSDLIALRRNETDLADPWLDHMRDRLRRRPALDRHAPRPVSDRLQSGRRVGGGSGHRRGGVVAPRFTQRRRRDHRARRPHSFAILRAVDN